MEVLSDPWSLRIPELEGCHNLSNLSCRWHTECSDQHELVEKRTLTMMIRRTFLFTFAAIRILVRRAACQMCTSQWGAIFNTVSGGLHIILLSSYHMWYESRLSPASYLLNHVSEPMTFKFKCRHWPDKACIPWRKHKSGFLFLTRGVYKWPDCRGLSSSTTVASYPHTKVLLLSKQNASTFRWTYYQAQWRPDCPTTGNLWQAPGISSR